MPPIEKAIDAALRSLPAKPADDAAPSAKKAYSELMSAAVAVAIGAELRRRGCKEARPAEPGEVGGSGAERRMAGGIGAKKWMLPGRPKHQDCCWAFPSKPSTFVTPKRGIFRKTSPIGVGIC